MPFQSEGGGFSSSGGGGGGGAVLPDHITCLSLRTGTNDRQAITISDQGPFGSILIDQAPGAGQAITIRGPSSGPGALLGGLQWRDSTLNLVAQLTPAVAGIDPFNLPFGAMVFYCQNGVGGIQVAMRILPNPGQPFDLWVEGDVYSRGVRLTAIQTKDGEVSLAELRGPQGVAGPQGIEGKIGPQGAEGKAGSVGPQGAQGPQGIEGKIGPQGLRGRDGKEGRQGLIGIGERGERGRDGQQGQVGERGPIGEKGPAGERGPVGEKGTPGLPGQAVLVRSLSEMEARMTKMETERQADLLTIRTLAAKVEALESRLVRSRRL